VEAVVGTVMSMLHLSDPLILRNTESAVCAARNTVATATIRLGRGFPMSEDDDDLSERWG